jgi:hypothetical protein
MPMGENPSTGIENCQQEFLHLKSHMDISGIEAGHLQ